MHRFPTQYLTRILEIVTAGEALIRCAVWSWVLPGSKQTQCMYCGRHRCQITWQSEGSCRRSVVELAARSKHDSYLASSMEQSPREASRCSAHQDNHSTSCNTKVHKSSPLGPILTHCKTFWLLSLLGQLTVIVHRDHNNWQQWCN
jgi:hypothetical protein